MLSPSGALVILPWLYSNLGYDPIKDFTPISRVTTFDFAVTAGPAAPAGDLKAVLAWLKANPGKANYATSGAGTVPHFAGQLLAQAAGVPLTHVAYKGGAPAAQDLIGGQVPLMVDTASETIEHHKAGKVRILAVTGERARRAARRADAQGAGINVAADAFFGLYGPAGMPADVVQRIERAVAKALRAPDMQDKIYAVGADAQPRRLGRNWSRRRPRTSSAGKRRSRPPATRPSSRPARGAGAATPVQPERAIHSTMASSADRPFAASAWLTTSATA